MPQSRIRSSSQLLIDADLDANSKKITNVSAPVSGGDAVNKTYADGLIAAADALTYKGAVDCSSNPNYPAADAGDTYKVSVGGKIGGASGVSVDAGDLFICTTDGTSAGTQAAVGANWDVIHMASATLPSIASQSILANDTGSTAPPEAVGISEQQIVGRITGGNIKGLTATEVRTLINVADGATNVTLPTFVTREAPSGTKNGINATFTLAHTPTAGSEELFLNGQLLNVGAGNDYTISADTITMLTGMIPVSTDVLLCTYRY